MVKSVNITETMVRRQYPSPNVQLCIPISYHFLNQPPNEPNSPPNTTAYGQPPLFYSRIQPMTATRRSCAILYDSVYL